MKAIVLLALFPLLGSQASPQIPPQPTRFAEFDHREEGIPILSERFQRFLSRLRLEPKTTRGYVALASKGLVEDQVKQILNRSNEKKRVDLVRTDCLLTPDLKTTEFWLVPHGAPEPYRLSCGDIICPTLDVYGKALVKNRKEKLYFTASISGDRSFDWSIKGGKIVAGKGTPSITVIADPRSTKAIAS